MNRMRSTVLFAVLIVASFLSCAHAQKYPLAPRHDAMRLHSDGTEHEHLMHRTRNRYRFLPYARYWPWHRSWSAPWKSSVTVTPKVAPLNVVQEVKQEIKAGLDAVGVAAFAQRPRDELFYPEPQRSGVSVILLLLFFIFSAAGLAFIMSRKRTE